jgi:hypothetical protein
MSGILNFENGAFWKIRGFYFDRFLEAVIARHQDDIELVEELRSGSACSLIDVASLRNEKGPAFAARLLSALTSTANAILSDATADIAELGKDVADVYHQTIRDLLAKLNAQKP